MIANARMVTSKSEGNFHAEGDDVVEFLGCIDEHGTQVDRMAKRHQQCQQHPPYGTGYRSIEKYF